MKRIDSPSNSTYKELKRIQSKGATTGFVLLEGERALRQLQADGLNFDLFVREEERSDATSLKADLFDKLADTKSPQGVIMKLSIPEEKLFDDGPVLILDRIMDPGNLGTLLRTASAFGIHNILLLEGCVDVYNPKVLRSSLGAVLTLRIKQRAGLSDVTDLKRPLYLADLGGEDFSEQTYPESFALVIGNEASGIQEGLARLPATRLTIPMFDTMESLNAAVAGGILMQAMTRR